MPAHYPSTPGFKRAGTSSDAAAIAAGSASTLRALILALLLRAGDKTPDEAAALLGKSVLAVRPRFSELLADGRIEPTGRKRRNASGLMANVYRAVVRRPTPPAQGSLL